MGQDGKGRDQNSAENTATNAREMEGKSVRTFEWK